MKKEEKKKQEKKKQLAKIWYLLLIPATLCIALSGILLPGQILGRQSRSGFDQVAKVPSAYYSGASSAMARNASAQMGVFQKLQLITGLWESETKTPDSYELQLEEYEAVGLARKGIEELNRQGLYPESLSSDYGSWYIWEAQPMKAVDMIFHTYTAYYWRIHFTKYDGSQTHTVYILEDGTVISAEAYGLEEMSPETIKSAQESKPQDSRFSARACEYRQERIRDYFIDPAADGSGLEWKALTVFESRENACAVMQAYSSGRYVFTVTPYEEEETPQ